MMWLEQYTPFQAMAPAPGAALGTPQRLRLSMGASYAYGGNQAWYPSWFQRLSGCGPVAAANLLWYLAATRPAQCAALLPQEAQGYRGMLGLMQALWKYITPGMRGVDKPGVLSEGAATYAARQGVALAARTLDIPAGAAPEAVGPRVQNFLTTSFANDLPVAFLNLSAGALPNLESWHWVTLTGVDGGLRAQASDQGRPKALDMALWLATTTRGGALVALEPQ